MTDDETRHQADEGGIDSRDAQSSLIGGGDIPVGLSSSRIGDANAGSQGKRHPGVWVAAWFGALVVVIAVIVLILR